MNPNLQLWVAAGLPTLAVLVGILINGLVAQQISNRIGSLENRMNSLEARMNGLETRMDIVITKLMELDNRLSKIER